MDINEKEKHLHFIKKHLKAKEGLWNSNISSCKNIIFQKSSKRIKILQDIITL
jgi:hypothetical protein